MTEKDARQIDQTNRIEEKLNRVHHDVQEIRTCLYHVMGFLQGTTEIRKDLVEELIAEFGKTGFVDQPVSELRAWNIRRKWGKK